MLSTILLVFAFVFFCIATFWPFVGPSAPGSLWGRFNPIAATGPGSVAGLAFWVLTLLIGGLHR